MDDNDLLAAVREDFSGVRMDTPAEAILADGASLRRRRRRRLAYGSGATALAAAAAISGVTLTSGAASTAGTHDAQLAAWTVQEQPNGVYVTLRDLHHLEGLGQKLRADGVPAEVISRAGYPAACVDYKAMKEGMQSVITPTTRPRVNGEFTFVIHPAAIPSGTRLLLVSGGAGDPPPLWGLGAASPKDGSVTVGMGLVHANSEC